MKKRRRRRKTITCCYSRNLCQGEKKQKLKLETYNLLLFLLIYLQQEINKNKILISWEKKLLILPLHARLSLPFPLTRLLHIPSFPCPSISNCLVQTLPVTLTTNTRWSTTDTFGRSSLIRPTVGPRTRHLQTNWETFVSSWSSWSL